MKRNICSVVKEGPFLLVWFEEGKGREGKLILGRKNIFVIKKGFHLKKMVFRARATRCRIYRYIPARALSDHAMSVDVLFNNILCFELILSVSAQF